MQHELRSIPPAPRRARMQPLLAHRWPLLLSGGFMVVIGALIAWAMFLQSSGSFSWGHRLDAGPTDTVYGAVRTVRPAIRFGGKDWDDVHYLAPWKDTDLYGYSFVDAGIYRVGDKVTIEVLTESPNINRIRDGVLRADRRWLYAQFWIGVMVVPGALLLLAWLTAMFQLRQVLVHGDVSVGRVLKVRTVGYVLPEMLMVTYEFRDHRAKMRKNRHWVRARGALGVRLAKWRTTDNSGELPVLHDRRFPQWNRLLLPQDFLESPAASFQDPIKP